MGEPALRKLPRAPAGTRRALDHHMTPRTLVVYYSRSGHTKNVAERIASALGADLEAVVDRTQRSGVLGYLRSGFEAFFDRPVEIAPTMFSPASYDLVIIGTPIWNMSVSSPIRAYLLRHRGALPNVAWFCTCGSSRAERVFGQMERLCGKRATATLRLREGEIDDAAPAIERFVVQIRTAIPPEPVVRAPAPQPPRPVP